MLRPIGSELDQMQDTFIGSEPDQMEAQTESIKTLAQVIIESLENEPDKWFQYEDKLRHKDNGSTLWDYYDNFIKLTSDPCVEFTREESKKLYAAVKTVRNRIAAKNAQADHKKAMARFGY